MTRPAPGRLLRHPAALAALVVLVVNDHFLKERFPGVVTGKLSDLAGMVVAPLVLVTVADAVAPSSWLRRPGYGAASAWACAALVAAVFAATKTWRPATEVYEAAFVLLWSPLRWARAWAAGREVWGERVVLVRDPTDLVALPLGAVAALIAQKR